VWNNHHHHHHHHQQQQQQHHHYHHHHHHNLSWYVRNSEVLPRKLSEKGTVKVDEAKDPKEYKKSKKREMENKWKEKQM